MKTHQKPKLVDQYNACATEPLIWIMKKYEIIDAKRKSTIKPPYHSLTISDQIKRPLETKHP